jgi:hypothetical protein
MKPAAFKARWRVTAEGFELPGFKPFGKAGGTYLAGFEGAPFGGTGFEGFEGFR